MLHDKDRIFTNVYGFQPWNLPAAQARGDWDGTARLMQLGQDEIIDIVKASGLRGRGGAGFPTGMKWGFMPKEPTPGRPISSSSTPTNPSPAAARTARSSATTRTSWSKARCSPASPCARAPPTSTSAASSSARPRLLFAGRAEAYDAGLLGKNAARSGYDFDVFVHRGAAPISAAKKPAMLESLEGKKGLPRLKPPIPGPARASTAARPRSTMSRASRSSPPSSSAAAAWFKRLRARKERRHQALPDQRPREQPAWSEEAMSIPFRELIDRHCGRHSRRLGQSARRDPGRLVRAAGAGGADHGRADGFRRLKALGSGLGTAAVHRHGQVDRHRPRDQPHLYFYKHESCGQCTPCREGTGWMWRVMERSARRQCRHPRDRHPLRRHQAVEGHTICALGDAAAWPIQGLIKHFRPRSNAASSKSKASSWRRRRRSLLLTLMATLAVPAHAQISGSASGTSSASQSVRILTAETLRLCRFSIASLCARCGRTAPALSPCLPPQETRTLRSPGRSTWPAGVRAA
jgi:NADH-quinone oxidoreductase subunit F